MVKKSVFKFLFIVLLLMHLVWLLFKLKVVALFLSQQTVSADFVLVFLVKFSLNLNVKSSMVCVSLDYLCSLIKKKPRMQHLSLAS